MYMYMIYGYPLRYFPNELAYLFNSQIPKLNSDNREHMDISHLNHTSFQINQAGTNLNRLLNTVDVGETGSFFILVAVAPMSWDARLISF